jgi:hypothetical protein
MIIPRLANFGKTPLAATVKMQRLGCFISPLLIDALAFLLSPSGPKIKSHLIAWEPYQKEHASEDTIRSWFENWPNANVGIVTGAVSGCVVIDLDSVEARDKLKTLLGDYDLAAVPRTRTGKGWQLFFKHPGVSIPNRAAVIPGLDVRGDGGYVVAPPSIHPNGRKYKWEVELTGELPEMPGELSRLITPESNHRDSDRGRFDSSVVWKGIPEGQRDHELFRYACQLRSWNVPRGVADRLILEAAALCRPPFPDRDALAKVEQAYKYAPGYSNGNGADQHATNDSQAVVLRLSDVQPKQLRWLWHSRIPLGKVTGPWQKPNLDRSCSLSQHCEANAECYHG